MSNVSWKKNKRELSLSATALKDGTSSLLCPDGYICFTNRTLFLTGILSFLIFGGAVSDTVTTYSSHEALRGNLCPQAGQYLFIMLAGMFMGIPVGPWFEQANYRIWRLLTNSGMNVDFRRYQVQVSASIVLIGLPVNLLFLLQRLNQFIGLNPRFKAEVVLLLYTMGLLTGGAWFLILHRKAGWGLLVSFTMSLMVIGNILSIHSWS